MGASNARRRRPTPCKQVGDSSGNAGLSKTRLSHVQQNSVTRLFPVRGMHRQASPHIHRRITMKIRHIPVMLIAIAYPLHLFAAPDGAALYESNCAACHQVSGGGIGLPLSASKLATVTDDYIKSTIRNGRVGRIMPAFSEMSSAQIDAITGYIRSWSGVSGPQYPDTPVLGDSKHGESLYESYCSSCHSVDGSGEGLGTGVTYSRDRSFSVMPPAITNPGFLASASDQMIKRVIMLGRPGTEMQSFLDTGLKENDFNDLVSYIRSFQHADREITGTNGSEAVKKPALIFDSPYDFMTTIDNIKSAIKGRNFRYFPDRYLENGLAEDTEINKRQMTIRFCNFNQLYKMMRIEPRLGVGLPCRITVVEQDDGRVQLIAMNMRLIAELFNNDQLLELSGQVHEVQIEIIEEATL